MTTEELVSEAPPGVAVVRAAVTGDRDATEVLLGYLRPRILRYCLGRLGGSDQGATSAEDCAQEILLAVLVELPRYHYDPGNFLSFVFGIAAHKVVDLYRRRDRDLCDPVPDLADGRYEFHQTVPDDFARTDGRLQLTELLDRLPEDHRTLLTMRIVLGFSAEETAAALNMPSAVAVRVAQHRVLGKLRQLLKASASVPAGR